MHRLFFGGGRLCLLSVLWFTSSGCQTDSRQKVTLAAVDDAAIQRVETQKEKVIQEPENAVVASLDLVGPTSPAELKTLKRIRVSVGKEPFYQYENAVFEGYDFGEIMALIPKLDTFDPAAHRLKFVCTDGYETTFPFSSIKGLRGVLANRFVETGEAKPFPERKTGATSANAGPWYLVWEGAQYGSKRPWPYQLTRIEVLSSAAYSAGVAPPPDAGVEEGFALFQKHCQACHTVNLKGGRMGPELNVPKNITEYRELPGLKAFIKNPQAFRATTTMPPTGLSDVELDSVLAYLESMAQRKVCATAQACAALLTAD